MGGAQKRRLSSDDEETIDQIQYQHGGGRNLMQPRAQRRSVPAIAAGTQPSRRDAIEDLVAAHDARHPDVRNHPSTTQVNDQARRVLGNCLNSRAFTSNTSAQRTSAGSGIGNGVSLRDSVERLQLSSDPPYDPFSLAQPLASLLAAGGVNSTKGRKRASPSATPNIEPKTRMRATAKRTTRPVRSSRIVLASSSKLSPEDPEASEEEVEKKIQHTNVARLFLKVPRPPGDWGSRPARRLFPPSSTLGETAATTSINIDNIGNDFQINELKECLKWLGTRNVKPTTRLSQGDRYKKQLVDSLRDGHGTRMIENETSTSSGRWVGLDFGLAPIHGISDIFEDIVSKSIDEDGPCKLAACLHELQGRKLRIGTMCSGTESPIIALKMINKALKRVSLPEISFQHVMSWENVPWKQAYIQRNFDVDVLFRDVTEITKSNAVGGFATTAFGSRVLIPGDLDLVIAGSSCVDFSSLNSAKKTLDEGGESARTFDGVARYTKLYKPKMIILENVKTAPWKKFAEVFQDIGYETVVGWMDTKDFYIPHTRERGYLFGILKESSTEAGLDPVRACTDWVTAVLSLRRRASSPFADFILKDDDPVLFDARRAFTYSDLLDSDTKKISWDKCFQRHMIVRGELQLGVKNPLTRWQKNGTCNFLDYGWGNHVKNYPERVWDTLDINLLRAVLERDYDISSKSRCLELSQNVDRSTDSYAWGMVGCLTCSAIPFVTSRGGPLIGREALALQGIPAQSLSLAYETSKDLQDFAGNAMTTTVVGSVAIAALCVTYPMLKIGRSDAQLASKSAVIPIKTHKPLRSADLTNNALSASTLNDIEALAGETLQLCACEGHVISKTVDLQECILCGHITCKVCGHNPTHVYEDIPDALSRDRRQPSEFEKKIRDLLPLQLHISKLTDSFEIVAVTQTYGDALQHAIEKAVDATVHLSTIRRGRHWIITYDSCFSRLELVFEPAWNILSPFRNACSILSRARWFLYAKPDSQRPTLDPLRDLLCSPIARMDCSNSLFDGLWKWRMLDDKCFYLNVKGSGILINSWQQNLGLEHHRFKNHQVWKLLELSLAEPAAEAYPENIVGTYSALPECGTACGTLHRLIGTPTGEPRSPMFFFLEQKPIGNSSLDSLVFAESHRRLLQGETRDISASAQVGWRPDPTHMGGPLTCKIPGFWKPAPAARLTVPPPDAGLTVQYSTLRSMGLQNVLSCLTTRFTVFVCEFPLQLERQRLWVSGQNYHIDLNDKSNALGPFDWLIQRASDPICRGDPICRNGSNCPCNSMSPCDWLEVPNRTHQNMSCTRCAPQQPVLVGRQIDNRTEVKYEEDPEQAHDYECAVRHRPSPVVTQLDCSGEQTAKLRIDLDVIALLHRAYAKLNPSGSKLLVFCRLVRDQQFKQLNRFPEIAIASNANDGRTPQLPETIFTHGLYDPQRQSLRWMLSQEFAYAGPWIEEEIEEMRMPAADLRLEALVRCDRLVRGGVLADAIGSGKTAVMLALVATDTMIAFRDFPASTFVSSGGSGLIQSKATLILTPKNLCDQWKTEIPKFYPENRFKVVRFDSAATFTAHTVDEIRNADIILAHWGVFNEDYFHRLGQISETPTDEENNKAPRQAGRAFEEWLDKALMKLRTRDEPTKADLDSPASFLHQFSFRRLMVDEYTYLSGIPFMAVVRLSAERRWIASGTPAIHSVGAVNRMAKLIGTSISNDENEGGMFETKKDLEASLKNKTAAERFLFHTFQARRSPDWYHARYKRCEQFVERFVRQNLVDLSHIKTKNHYSVVTLPAGERATYQEVLQLILNSCLNFNRANPELSKLSIRSHRLDAFARMSGSAEEALIVSSSTSTPMVNNEDPFARSGTADVSKIFIDKCQQLGADIVALIEERAKARCYMRTFGDDGIKANPHLPGFDRDLREGLFGDKTAQHLIDLAMGTGEELGVKETMKPDPEDKGSDPKQRKHHMLVVAANLTSKSLELVQNVRGYRLYKQIQDFLMEDDLPDCPSCSPPISDRAQMMILTTCGHVLCSICTSRITDGQCPVPDCGAAVPDHSAVPLDSFQQFITKGEQFGTKINDVVQLLLDGHLIKAQERVVIFVQFARIQEALQHALNRRDADFCTASGKGNPVQRFSEGEGPRFLILNIDSADAAGWNLQRANHVVFVHSMVANSQYHWQASHEQAIGRVCRRGQRQKVSVWRFLTANTIDVNILEDREERRLGWDGSKYSLMTVQEIAAKGLAEADCALRGVGFVGKAAGAGLRELE